MNAYIFQADLYCEKCARELMGFYSARRGEEDSDDYPQGPYPDGGGEADCPNHCGECHTFLENPLTEEGRDYVLAVAVEEHDKGGIGRLAQMWLDHYGIDISEDIHAQS